MDLSLVTSLLRSKYPHWVIVQFLFIKHLQNSSYFSLFLLRKSFTSLSSCFLWFPLCSGICDYNSSSAPVITRNTVLTMWTDPLWSSYYFFSTTWCFNFCSYSHSFIIFFPACNVTYLKLSFWFCLCCLLSFFLLLYPIFHAKKSIRHGKAIRQISCTIALLKLVSSNSSVVERKSSYL